MALWTRQRAGIDVAGVVHHSDRGVQYLAIRYADRLAANEIVASVGSKGDSYDCEDPGGRRCPLMGGFRLPLSRGGMTLLMTDFVSSR